MMFKLIFFLCLEFYRRYVSDCTRIAYIDAKYTQHFLQYNIPCINQMIFRNSDSQLHLSVL